MRIYDVIVESDDQLDEGIASTIGQGLGAVGRGIGAVASVPQGIGRAVKRGYQAGLDTISGDAPGTAAAQAGGAVPTTGGAGGSGLGVGGGFEAHRGSGGDDGAGILFDAVHEGLGAIPKAEGGLERVGVLQVAKGEAVLDLLGDAVHAIFDRDVFHTASAFLLFVALLRDASLLSARTHAQTPRPGCFDLSGGKARSPSFHGEQACQNGSVGGTAGSGAASLNWSVSSPGLSCCMATRWPGLKPARSSQHPRSRISGLTLRAAKSPTASILSERSFTARMAPPRASHTAR